MFSEPTSSNVSAAATVRLSVAIGKCNRSMLTLKPRRASNTLKRRKRGTLSSIATRYSSRIASRSPNGTFRELFPVTFNPNIAAASVPTNRIRDRADRNHAETATRPASDGSITNTPQHCALPDRNRWEFRHVVLQQNLTQPTSPSQRRGRN